MRFTIPTYAPKSIYLGKWEGNHYSKVHFRKLRICNMYLHLYRTLPAIGL